MGGVRCTGTPGGGGWGSEGGVRPTKIIRFPTLMNTVVFTPMNTFVLTVVCTPGKVSPVPKTEKKRHISLTLTQGELEELDRYAETLGEGTFRNEAVVSAVRSAMRVILTLPVSPFPSQGQDVKFTYTNNTRAGRWVEPVEE
jgi:hypothetical protein